MVASLPTKELVQIDTTIRQVRSPFAKIAVDAAFFVGDYPSRAYCLVGTTFSILRCPRSRLQTATIFVQIFPIGTGE